MTYEKFAREHEKSKLRKFDILGNKLPPNWYRLTIWDASLFYKYGENDIILSEDDPMTICARDYCIYHRNISSNTYSISFDVSIESNIKKWCDENIDGNWKLGKTFIKTSTGSSGERTKPLIQFIDDASMVLFKLKWG